MSKEPQPSPSVATSESRGREPSSPNASRASSVSGPTSNAITARLGSSSSGRLASVPPRTFAGCESDNSASTATDAFLARQARGAVNPSPPAAAGAAPHCKPHASQDASAVHPRALQERAILSIAIHLPVAILLLFLRGAETAAATKGYITWQHGLAIYAPLVAWVAVREQRNEPSRPLVILLLALGIIVGAAYPAVADAPFWRLLAFAFVGYCCGSLRFLWATKRLSRRMPHRASARISNFFKRTGGIAPIIVVGELIGCFVFVPDGWLVVTQSWYGYALTTLFPLLLVQVGSLAAMLLTRVFGGDGRHVVGRVDATRVEVVRWTATLTAATVLLIGALAFFVMVYVPYLWVNQLLMTPYALATDILAFRALKAASKAQRVGPTSGKELYKAVSRKHDKLITDVMSKSNEFHCH